MLYADVQNAYAFKNKGQDYVVREKDANGNYVLLDNGTKYSLQSLPSISGTVLPTIGVMIEF
jgi:nitrogen fixation protein